MPRAYSSNTPQDVHTSQPVLSQLSGYSHVLTVRTYHSHNLVICGIPECKKGISKHLGLSNSLSFVTNALNSVDPIMGDYSIKDCHKLGKYSTHTCHAQPILVKFNQTSEVSRILYKGVVACPILSSLNLIWHWTKSTRSTSSQRWQLMHSGISRKVIRIQGS